MSVCSYVKSTSRGVCPGSATSTATTHMHGLTQYHTAKLIKIRCGQKFSREIKQLLGHGIAPSWDDPGPGQQANINFLHGSGLCINARNAGKRGHLFCDIRSHYRTVPQTQTNLLASITSHKRLRDTSRDHSNGFLLQQYSANLVCSIDLFMIILLLTTHVHIHF